MCTFMFLKVAISKAKILFKHIFAGISGCMKRKRKLLSDLKTNLQN